MGHKGRLASCPASYGSPDGWVVKRGKVGTERCPCFEVRVIVQRLRRLLLLWSGSAAEGSQPRST